MSSLFIGPRHFLDPSISLVHRVTRCTQLHINHDDSVVALDDRAQSREGLFGRLVTPISHRATVIAGWSL